jgi:iron(II)-dependent oxidoreductase
MTHSEDTLPNPKVLAEWVKDARRRTLELIHDLDDEHLIGPPLPTLNPLLWEIGHVAWFQEKWLLRHANRRPPLMSTADNLYDSAGVSHDSRWHLPLPSRERTLGYMALVEEQVLEILDCRVRTDEVYFTLLSLFHEDMHTEARRGILPA